MENLQSASSEASFNSGEATSEASLRLKDLQVQLIKGLEDNTSIARGKRALLAFQQ